MRLVHLLPIALLAVAACHENGVSVNQRPPLGGVRFINAVPDGGPVDIRMIDQVEWSASSVSGTAACCGLAFRAGTIHWATEAKPRHIRVFPSDSSIAITSQILHDTTITIEADKNVTLMLVGSRVAGTVRFIRIDDNPAPSSSQVAVRVVNATSAGITAPAAGYITATATTALPATADFGSVAALSASPYVMRAPSTGFAIRTTPVGDNTTIWSAAAPDGAPAAGLVGATAGANGPGSGLSAYLFPRSTAGTAAPQTAAFQAPAVIWFVDLIPKPPT